MRLAAHGLHRSPHAPVASAPRAMSSAEKAEVHRGGQGHQEPAERRHLSRMAKRVQPEGESQSRQGQKEKPEHRPNPMVVRARKIIPAEEPHQEERQAREDDGKTANEKGHVGMLPQGRGADAFPLLSGTAPPSTVTFSLRSPVSSTQPARPLVQDLSMATLAAFSNWKEGPVLGVILTPLKRMPLQ